MSIFRPLNSDESNLFTIRCVIEWGVSSITSSQIIAGGSNITVDTDLLKTPTANNLPSNFTIFYSGSVFYVGYGKQFTSCPSVSLQPRLYAENDLDDTGTSPHVPIPVIYWNNITDYAAIPQDINSGNFNFAFSFRDTSNALITPTTYASTQKMSGFDLIITGPVKLGVTTGNSNKGWAVGSGNDATNAYTFMNVGIGTGNPTSALQVQGRLDSFIYKAVDASTGPDAADTLTAAQTVCEVLNCTPASAGFNLTTLSAANIIAALLDQKNHTAAVNDAFNLTINNLSPTTGYDITLTAGTNVTISGNDIIYPADATTGQITVGSATFRHVITSVTSGSEAVTIIRIA